MSNAAATARHPVLDKAEWDLVMELLERERREIPVEIHHADRSDTRQQLHHRRDLVEGLLRRLEATSVIA